MQTDNGATPALYRMLAWLSPAFPVGAFSFSHGLEAATEAGTVHNRVSLQDWIAAIVARGAGRIDADILREAYRAAQVGDTSALRSANQRGVAFRGTAETRLETMAQGRAFLETCVAAWPDRFLSDFTEAASAVCYPAAVGAAMARAQVSLEWALTGYLQAMAANLVSAGLRLGIIGQTDGQRILAALEPIIGAAVTGALTRDADAFGSAAFAVELASMAHEIQYTRLFRS